MSAGSLSPSMLSMHTHDAREAYEHTDTRMIAPRWPHARDGCRDAEASMSMRVLSRTRTHVNAPTRGLVRARMSRCAR
eukprot:6212299-Pleurochrysis_carterae.AAC.2